MLGGGHPRWARHLLSDEDFAAIAQAVTEMERQTSGEIRVHLERHLPPDRDALARAKEVFEKLGMAATAERSGVLIYLAVDDRRLAIAGDAGVHARVGAEYWQHIRDAMVERLREGRAREAIVHAVREVGEVLRRFFPRRPDDRNELSDDVSVS